MTITKQQYESALSRIEELLLIVNEDTPATDRCAVELIKVSDMVEAYEKEHYPMGKNIHYPREKSQDSEGWKRL